MAKRKRSDEQPPAAEPDEAQEAAAAAAEDSAEKAAYIAVAAPEKIGRATTIDNRLGYRKEASAETGNEQIRFANRPGGGRPDDELLAPLRDKKPDVKYQSREKSWAAQTQKGVDLIDDADDELANIGRRRRDQGQGR